MFVVGILYLFFEDSIIEQLPSTKRNEAKKERPLISRAVIGVQVGLVVLAIFVTRSSVVSLQAKQGLPLGTQLVGWLTMSKHLPTFSISAPNISSSCLYYRTNAPPPPTK
jgi:phosphatidylinositol glycan class N